ncbi:MAG: hypothetical protein LZF86_240126 [Nitrospira sp.]|nr:MAG: hypothetical protein LZF86_240126 [Nitrospira sp.]
MKTSIFFSWQSDAPTKTGRNFLRKALEEACEEIEAESYIDDALRDELIVDSDTQGEAGQPPIAETIFRKIDAAAVFVADVTFAATRVDGRPTPNPNVLIEYGWALKSLGHSRVISVMNDAYGEPSHETLPFDLAHVRWPTRFKLPEGASDQQKADERRKLVTSLKKAIKASIATISLPPAQPAPIFPKAAPKDGPARFRSTNVELGYDEGHWNQGSYKVFLKPGPAIWLRVMPATPPQKSWTPRQLKELAISGNTIHLLPFLRSSGYSWLRAEDGWGVFDVSGAIDEQQNRKEASSTVFAFQTGEIWSTDTTLLARHSKWIPFFEENFNERCAQYAHFLKMLDVPPPYHWIAGITGVKGRQLTVPPESGYMDIRTDGPLCVSDSIEVEGTYRAGQTTKEAMLPFYTEIFEKCGMERPSYLNG